MSNSRERGAAALALPPDCQQQTMGVVFFDLSRFAEWGGSEQDEQVAEFLQSFYVLSSEVIGSAGGRIVKFMGDAGLAVFDPDAAEAAIDALDRLARQVRALALEAGLDAYLNIKVHVGPVLTGSFGAPGVERFDVIGKTVNVAARLGRRGMILSAQAFRCLGPEARQRFNKNMPPITYRASTTY